MPVRLALCLILLTLSAARADAPQVPDDVRAILTAKCVACHGPDDVNGDVRLDTLSADLINDRRAGESWLDALHALQLGEMPPEEADALTDAEYTRLTEWISGAIDHAAEVQRMQAGHVTARRLNREEYQNTMRDLLDLDIDYTRDFSLDSRSPDGFTNDAESLLMSANQLESYLITARRALAKVVVDGEQPEHFHNEFTESNVTSWRGPIEPSNRLGRSQTFAVVIKDDYPDWGDVEVRVHLTAELPENAGYPILDCSLGVRPDTQLAFESFEPVEITSAGEQVITFSGRIEEFPLPARGKGKYPGLILRLRNLYTDGSPLPKAEKPKKDANNKRRRFNVFAPEPHLPTIIISKVEFVGPVLGEWPPARHRRILPESPLRTEDEAAYARQVLSDFLTRAFRRPATEQEIEQTVRFFGEARSRMPKFEDALRETLAFTLIRPEFLYRLPQTTGGNKTLDDFALASRLSYFLWRTMPDERLLDLAAQNRLHEPKVLAAEVDRLLSDPRTEQFVQGFVEDWLQTGRVHGVAVNPNYYPEFDDEAKWSMQREPQALFGHLLKQNASALRLLDAETTFVNEPLARHYGIAGVYGEEFREVSLSETERVGGLLGQAAFHLIGSTGDDSHAVLRAVWVRDRLLGDPPGNPPPNVPTLDEADKKFHELSIREQLRIHREDRSCAACHNSLDPYGVALEGFDAVGLPREQVRRQVGRKFKTHPVDKTDTLPDGTTLSGAEALRQHLVEQRSEDFARSLVRRLSTFALGRRLELGDRADIESLTAEFITSDYKLRGLVRSLVLSELFHRR